MAPTAMEPERRQNPDKPGIELLEEATQVLRTAPIATLTMYYVGAIPFVLGFLYFWTDMSRSAFASQHLAEASLGTAALFIWMKFCQALFAARLRAQVAADEVSPYTLAEYGRILFAQAVLQPLGLFLVPVALVLGIPFGWVYAFFQNLTAQAVPVSAAISDVAKKAWKQTLLSQGQNHLILGIALLFAMFVFLNWMIVAMSIPGILKTLIGVESVFTQSPVAMLNTTFFAGISGLTYLTIDPLLKAVYVLRCFYGESRQSGEDLKSDLKRFAASLSQMAGALLVLLLLTSGSVGAGTRGLTPLAVSSAELNQRIDEVIHSSRYAWRLPRDPLAQSQAEDGMIARFFYAAGRMLRSVLRTVVSWIDRFFEGLFGRSNSRGLSGFSWSSSSLLLYGLLAAVVLALAVFIIRTLRGKTSTPIVAEAVPIRPAPDVNDENVSADQLPEDGWMSMARDLLGRGEFRLAMRAFYLASLAHLGQCNLISIARFKSNRDYENELRRRGHAFPELLPVFGANVLALERIWYGRHGVNDEVVREFASNVDKIRAVQ
jgi:hypothetical protein